MKVAKRIRAPSGKSKIRIMDRRINLVGREFCEIVRRWGCEFAEIYYHNEDSTSVKVLRLKFLKSPTPNAYKVGIYSTEVRIYATKIAQRTGISGETYNFRIYENKREIWGYWKDETAN